jgi:hypothetical protein
MQKFTANRINYKNIIKIVMIASTLFLLYVFVGIFLNSSVSIKFNSVSKEDIEYVSAYSKITIVYLFLILVLLLASFKK